MIYEPTTLYEIEMAIDDARAFIKEREQPTRYYFDDVDYSPGDSDLIEAEVEHCKSDLNRLIAKRNRIYREKANVR